ncbi:basic proline-rich protein-like [Iris pallida]|uniref:Basic proline-rich protein-like n=1 Tax=Iris pallida TaxID=29817 RepID=A0AAX6ILC6_IRIPA|nr:basic proline-rich protein-like [Iris pallida]
MVGVRWRGRCDSGSKETPRGLPGHRDLTARHGPSSGAWMLYFGGFERCISAGMGAAAAVPAAEDHGHRVGLKAEVRGRWWWRGERVAAINRTRRWRKI